MNRLLLTLTLILGLIAANNVNAQKAKVIESQPKKQPAWVNTLVKDYIIAVGSASTLEDAQEKALVKVKEHIISSVADNVSSKSEYTLVEDNQSGDMSIKETYKVATRTRAADIPFIKGISLNQVEEYYWAKVKESDGRINFYYHIKYPFSDFQLKKLVMEYEKADRELTKQLDLLTAKIDETNRIEELQQTHSEIKALMKSFIDVDNRYHQSQVATAKIEAMLKNVSIEPVSQTLGEVRFTINIGDKVMTTTAKPRVKSNCAKVNDVKSVDSEWVAKYMYEECYDDPDNKIIVEYRNQFGKTQREFFFNVKAETIDIFVKNEINFTGGTDNGTEIYGCNCFVPIVSKYDSPFVVTKIVLNFGNEAPIIIDNIGMEFSGKGTHDLNLIVSQALDKSIYTAKKYQFIKGVVYYQSAKTGEQSSYQLYNQPITTNW